MHYMHMILEMQDAIQDRTLDSIFKMRIRNVVRYRHASKVRLHMIHHLGTRRKEEGTKLVDQGLVVDAYDAPSLFTFERAESSGDTGFS